MKNKSMYIDRSREFIDCIGYKELAQELKVVPQKVCNWRRRGIPQGWAVYLSSIYKDEWKKVGLLDL